MTKIFTDQYATPTLCLKKIQVGVDIPGMPERRSGGELSAHLLRLTHALYRVTDVLPRDEPLRRGVREKAGEIFSAGVAIAHGKGKNNEANDAWIAIEILLGYLAMARVLGCANPMNFLVLEREYRLLADDMISGSATETAGLKTEEKNQKKEMSEARPVAPVSPAIGESKADGEVNERQRKIMERLAAAGQVKVSDFYDTFDAISSKTIQRDLQDLMMKNLIKKEGEKRWTTYTLA